MGCNPSGVRTNVLLATFAAGYTINHAGVVWSPRLRELKLIPDHEGYLYFSGKRIAGLATLTVRVHRLQAFHKFGNRMFEPGLEVRHLDNDSSNNSRDNIGLGTHQENCLDVPVEVRKLRMLRLQEVRLLKLVR